MGSLNYDIFLSYASGDASWAQKLETDLMARNVRVFRDKSRLQIGRRWERDLQQSLDNSRHFVVIWTAKAKESDWVQKEMARFDMHAEQDPERRLICLNLEGANPAYSFFQAIETLKTAEGGPPDAGALDGNRWNDVIARIVGAIEDDDQTERIPTAVLAMTQREADPTQPGGLGAKDLDIIQEAFALSPAAVKDRYGDTRLDWRPYGGAPTIRTMLDTLIGDVNTVVKGNKFRSSLVGDEFWADMTTGGPAEVATSMANARISLVVIDALSLRSPDVKDRAILLLNYLRLSRCAWIFVPPLPSEPQMLNYRKAIRGWTVGLLDEYFNPPIPRVMPFKAHVGLFCGDDGEIRRLLQTVISDCAPDDRMPKSAYTQFQQGQ